VIYGLSLQTAGLAAGLLLVVSHAAGLLNPSSTIRAARQFPRSNAAAAVLLLIAAVWSFLLVRTIDLGEFSPLRNTILFGIVAGTVLSWFFVREFLAARALGMLALLAAEPLLESAVLRGEQTRLILVVLAYAWVAAGLFLVGMPYLLRDAIAFASATTLRWRLASLGGLAYGAAVIVCALAFW
jgi:hypothetical protein